MIRCPIFMYHQVTPADHPSFNRHLSVTVERFEEQVSYLKRQGFTFTTVAQLLSDKNLDFKSKRYAVLTFDDIFACFHTYALPMLKKLDVPATAYVIGNSLLGKPYHDLDPAGLEPLSPTQIQELMAAGIEIGSHAMSHREMTSLTDEEAFRELKESHDLIKDRTGYSKVNFCFPSGSHSLRHLPMLKEIGYRSAVLTERGNSHDLSKPYQLKRVKVSQKHTGLKLRYLCSRVYNLMYQLKSR